MYRRKSRQYCAAMLIVSVCMRLCMLLGLDDKLSELFFYTIRQPETAEFLLFLETGQTVRLTEKEPPAPEVVVLTRQPPQPREVPITVEKSVPVKGVPAQQIAVAGGCSYLYDKQALLLRQTQMELYGEGPQILIIHSHTTEAYSQSDGMSYEPASAFRTLDAEHNVTAVGAVLAQELTRQGIEVIHDTAVYDYPNYNTSYWSCLQGIEAWKTKYPGIQMVIDIHRDAVENEQGQAVAMLSEQNGQTMAQLMLVVGTDEGGLEHPDWQENLANALKLQSVLQAQYPGLCRKLDLRTERFNQHATPGSILIEVGTNGNTLTQAQASAQLLGKAIGELFWALKENGGVLQIDAAQ